MENSYKEINLGSLAINYIQECLVKGNTLAKYLLQKHNLHDGKIITLIPAYATDEQINHFEWGIHRESPPETHIFRTDEHGRTTRIEPIINVRFWLVDIISEYLSAGEIKCCIFEDPLCRPTSPVILNDKTKILIFDSEIY